MPSSRSSTRKTILAARAFSRRALLKGGLAAGALSLAGCQTTAPAAGPKPRHLNVAIWSDLLPASFQTDFARDTGIEIVPIDFDSNIELLTMVRSAREKPLDLIGPTHNRAPLWQTRELLQPIDPARVDTDSIMAPLMNQTRKLWAWDGQLYHLPMLWGTEALAWRSDQWSPDLTALSYGDLWRPEMKGKVQGRPHSMMLAIGLYLDRIGEVPSNRMLDAYGDPERMVQIWDAITRFAIDHRFWINQFWNSAYSQRRGFTEEGCIIGQTWDGPINALKIAGESVTFMAPQEGALTWMSGISIPANARNLDEVYVFLDYFYQPEIAGRLASATDSNPVQQAALDFMESTGRQAYLESLPGDALKNLWFWPPTPRWYRQKSSDFRDEYVRMADRYPDPV